MGQIPQHPGNTGCPLRTRFTTTRAESQTPPNTSWCARAACTVVPAALAARRSPARDGGFVAVPPICSRTRRDSISCRRDARSASMRPAHAGRLRGAGLTRRPDPRPSDAAALALPYAPDGIAPTLGLFAGEGGSYASSGQTRAPPPHQGFRQCELPAALFADVQALLTAPTLAELAATVSDEPIEVAVPENLSTDDGAG